MSLFRLDERMTDDVLFECSNDVETNVCKTVTTTGEIQSSLNGSDVYSVSITVSECRQLREPHSYQSIIQSTI